MRDEQEFWSSKLDNAQEEFSQTKTATESKERMYNQIMAQVAKDKPVLSFEQSQQKVEKMSSKSTEKNTQQTQSSPNREKAVPKKTEEQRRKTPIKRKPSIFFTRVVPGFAAAALVAVAVVNFSSRPQTAIMNNQYFSPSLSQEDLPVALTSSGLDYCGIAGDNNFYVAYEQNPELEDKINLLVHSRSCKINWKRLFITDADNNQISPTFTDEKNSVVTIPVSSSDLTFEVADDEGNVFICIIPKEI